MITYQLKHVVTPMTERQYRMRRWYRFSKRCFDTRKVAQMFIRANLKYDRELKYSDKFKYIIKVIK